MSSLRCFLLATWLSYVFAQDVMLGCYSDTSNPPLLNGLAGIPTMPNPYVYEYQSSGKCTEVCSSNDFTYAGTQNGNECYCGNYTPPLSLRVSPSKCNIPCFGYPLESCGGAKYLNVYIISDRKPSSSPLHSSDTPSTTSEPITPSSSSSIASVSSFTLASSPSTVVSSTISVSSSQTNTFSSDSNPTSKAPTQVNSSRRTNTASPTVKTIVSGSESFLKNKALAASIFTLAAVILIGIIIAGYVIYRMRKRRKAIEMGTRGLPNFTGYFSRRSSISLRDDVDYTNALRVTNPD